MNSTQDQPAWKLVAGVGLGIIVILFLIWLYNIVKSDSPDALTKCSSSIECKFTEVCSDGRCRPVACDINNPCIGASMCSDGVCVPLGFGCSGDAQCPANYRCEKGECVDINACKADMDCGLGSMCVEGKCVSQTGPNPGTGTGSVLGIQRTDPVPPLTLAIPQAPSTPIPPFASPARENSGPIILSSLPVYNNMGVQTRTASNDWVYVVGPDESADPTRASDLLPPTNGGESTVRSVRKIETGPAVMEDEGHVNCLDLVIGTTPISDSSASYGGRGTDRVVVSVRVNGKVVQKIDVDPANGFEGKGTADNNPSHIRHVRVNCLNPIPVKEGDVVDAEVNSSYPIRASVTTASDNLDGVIYVSHPFLELESEPGC